MCARRWIGAGARVPVSDAHVALAATMELYGRLADALPKRSGLRGRQPAHREQRWPNSRDRARRHLRAARPPRCHRAALWRSPVSVRAR